MKKQITFSQLKRLVKESFDEMPEAYTVRNNDATFSGSDQPKEYGTYHTAEDAEKMRQFLAKEDPERWNLKDTEVVKKDLDPMLPVHWDEVQDTDEEEWCVVRTGGSIGVKFTHRVAGTPCIIQKDGMTRDEARDEAKAFRRFLSPGERKYYGYSYKAVPKAALKSISNAQVAEGPNDASIEKARKEFNEMLEEVLKDAEKETMSDGTFPELVFRIEDAIENFAPGLKGKLNKLHELASIYSSLVHFNV